MGSRLPDMLAWQPIPTSFAPWARVNSPPFPILVLVWFPSEFVFTWNKYTSSMGTKIGKIITKY